MAKGLSVFIPIAISCFSAVSSREIFNYSILDLLPQSQNLSIIGGQEADIKDHPHQVALLYKEKDKYGFVCGGMIISKDFILTAAHCLKDNNASIIVVSAGSTWPTNGTYIEAAELKLHPHYGNGYDNDVGLIRTVRSIQFTDVIKPIKLQPKQKPLEDDSLVTVAGWGLTEENKASPHLRSVQIPVVNFYKCWSSYHKVYVLVTRNMWCGGNFEKGGIGPCSGDSGGAAVQGNVAVGIVSWAVAGCARPKYPVAFTDIGAPSIRDFITKHTGL